MRHIKTYLNLALAITFCASINTVSMEKERSDESREWSDQPTGTSNTSSESGLEDGLGPLEKQINRLKEIGDTINNILKSNISFAKYNGLKTLKNNVLTTLTTAKKMSLDHLAIDITFIDEEIDAILAQLHKILSY